MGDKNIKFVKNYINQKNGAFITQFDVDEKAAAKQEADLKKASEQKKFKVPPGMIVDWTGDKYVYVRPYGDQNVQLSEEFAYGPPE